jgi:hypothetical protein
LYSGNLLSDSALLSSLNETKAKASTVAAALEDGKQLVTELDQQRSVYRPLAARGSALYFSLLHLRRLDNMYCFSLPVRSCWLGGVLGRVTRRVQCFHTVLIWIARLVLSLRRRGFDAVI